MSEVGGKLAPTDAEMIGIGIEEEFRARTLRDFSLLSVIVRTIFSSESIGTGSKSRGLVVTSQLFTIGSISIQILLA
jgi:hypothetical protein